MTEDRNAPKNDTEIKAKISCFGKDKRKEKKKNDLEGMTSLEIINFTRRLFLDNITILLYSSLTSSACYFQL